MVTKAALRMHTEIRDGNWQEIGELRSTHKEVDTRVLIHAASAEKEGRKAVVVMAEDTYSLVLSLLGHEPDPVIFGHRYHPRGIMLIVIFGRVYISTVRNYVIALHWW